MFNTTLRWVSAREKGLVALSPGILCFRRFRHSYTAAILRRTTATVKRNLSLDNRATRRCTLLLRRVPPVVLLPACLLACLLLLACCTATFSRERAFSLLPACAVRRRRKGGSFDSLVFCAINITASICWHTLDSPVVVLGLVPRLRFAALSRPGTMHSLPSSSPREAVKPT